MSYVAAPGRYETMLFRQCGKTGLKLPALSLGLWHNFGDTTPLEKVERKNQRQALQAAIAQLPPFHQAYRSVSR